jgi:hypothetical protein
MSLGYGYDMVLLPSRHPTDHDYELFQRGGALRRYHHSRRARIARRQHTRCSHRHHRPEEGDTTFCPGAPQSDPHAMSLIEDLCGMSLATDETPGRHLVIPPTAAAPPVGSRAVSLTAGSMPLWTFPYGLNTVAQQYASSVSASMHIYEEFPGHHPRSSLDFVASTPTSKY